MARQHPLPGLTTFLEYRNLEALVARTSQIEIGDPNLIEHHAKTKLVPISYVRVNEKKLRKLSTAKIRQYAGDYDSGSTFPPIVVEDCGGFYTVRDGRHRLQAQLKCGYTMIEVCVYN